MNSCRYKNDHSIIQMHGCHVSSPHGATIVLHKNRLQICHTTLPETFGARKKGYMTRWKFDTVIQPWNTSIPTFVEAVEGKRGIDAWPSSHRNRQVKWKIQKQKLYIDIRSWVQLVELRRQGSLEVNFILEMAFLYRTHVLMAECGCEYACKTPHSKQMRFHSTLEFSRSLSWWGFYL